VRVRKADHSECSSFNVEGSKAIPTSLVGYTVLSVNRSKERIGERTVMTWAISI